jgi:hypothetical protein
MARIIPWRPRLAACRFDPIDDLWTMAKRDCQINCVIERGGRLGWTVRVQINRQWSVRCEFTSRLAALDAAEFKYRELLSAGWKPATS